MFTTSQLKQLEKAVGVFNTPGWENDLDMYEWLVNQSLGPDSTVYDFKRLVNAIKAYHEGK